MEDFVKLHNWVMNEQNFVPIPDTKKYLSVVPEYLYKQRDPEGKIITSRTPVGVKLNCALQEGGENVDYVEFYTENEFLNYINQFRGFIFI
jgi:hypothetical protein